MKGVLQKCTQYKSPEGERKIKSRHSVYLIISGDQARVTSIQKTKAGPDVHSQQSQTGEPLCPHA